MRYLTPSFISILGLGAITSAVMSSADSSVLSASSLITNNIYYSILRPRASVREISTVVRVMVCLVGVATTVMALSVQSVYTLWSLCADAVYVVLFPQLVCLFYMDHVTNTYGLICGVSTGLVIRLLCGEPAMHVPVVLKLPLYDEDAGQKFPHRTLCMLLNLGATLVGSLFWERVFRLGYVPKSFDYCRCFAETCDEPHVAAAAALDTKPFENSRADASQLDVSRLERSHAGVSRAGASRSGWKPADTTAGDADRTEGSQLFFPESSRMHSRAPNFPVGSQTALPATKAASRLSTHTKSQPGGASVHSTKSSQSSKSTTSSEPSHKRPESDIASAKSSDSGAAKDAPSVRSAAGEHERQTAGADSKVPRSKPRVNATKMEAAAPNTDGAAPVEETTHVKGLPKPCPSKASRKIKASRSSISLGSQKKAL
ncbi:uncharacterized protein LOC144126083 [Amblyomma americanum]